MTDEVPASVRCERVTAEDRCDVTFALDGEVRRLRNPAPTRTLLQYLREDLGRTGTKEGCAEGDCGACTVVVVDIGADSQVRVRAVNACIQFLPVIDGKEIVTVESLAGPDEIGRAHV